ncbi:MAG TPA: hypothetical protein VKB58_05645 [Terriglobales bacterium]|jgi:hypothetical protein|nr:hypothetical protein [Terriglobales bacterium]
MTLSLDDIFHAAWIMDSYSIDVLESVLVANPDYELVLFDRLPPEQRELLKDLLRDPNFYGILRPAGKTNLGVKSVSRDIALLYFTMQQPGRLPEYVQASMGPDARTQITRLILDGVLALQQDGKLLSGPGAAAVLCGRGESRTGVTEPAGFLYRLSLEALRYAEALDLTDSVALSARLYGYNRLPLTPRWKHMLAGPQGVTTYLRLHHAPVRELLQREWLPAPSAANNDGWLVWQSRRLSTSASFSERGSVGCKLYISVSPEGLREAFPSILLALTHSRARAFKVGKNASGLLRPDKMVAYFGSLPDLMDTSERLKQALAGCAAHGVPFTAEITDDGLLSWGADPPMQDHAVPWIAIESWRLWVTNRLAVALISARNDNSSSLPPWEFALQRLQLEGIDTRSWAPPGADWKPGLAGGANA